MQKMQHVRDRLTRSLNRAVNNGDILDTVLNYWIDSHDPSEKDDSTTTSFAQVDRKDTEDSLFVTASTSLQRLVTISENHARLCRHKQKIVKTVYRGHVVVNTLQCDNAENPHITKWSSSPYLPNNEFLVNHRMHLAITCSGMLPVHYTMFADTASKYW